MNVAIIGGGPAGAMLAHRLGQKGVSCTLFEKNGAWEKPCGGGIPPKVRDMVPEVNDYDGDRNPVALGEFVSPSGRSILLQSKRPMWVVSRKQFGRYMLDLARSHDSVTYKKRAVKQVREAKNGFEVVSDQTETFDFVAGADGCRSKVAAATGSGVPKDKLTMCVGYFIEGRGEDKAISWMLPASGYLWAFPRKDHICVGGGFSDPRLSIITYAGAIIETLFPDRKRLSKWAAPIPFIQNASFFDRPFCGKNWALLGDAAGHVDAVTGEGILYALRDGMLLADAIVEERPERYAQACLDTFGPHLRKASDISLKFYKPEIMEKMFRFAQRSPTMREILMDLMTDQPNYVEARKAYGSKMWRIMFESLRGK